MRPPSLFPLVVFELTNIAAAALSPCTSHWVNLAPLPEPRQEVATAAIGNTTIAVVGGIVPAGDGVETTNLVQLYDIASDAWHTVSPAPIKVNHPNLAYSDGKLYLLGGLVDAPAAAGSSVNWVATGLSYAYDVGAGTWAAIAPMPNGTERGSGVVGVYRDLIYLAGGMTLLQDQYQDTVSTVTAFNTTSGAWQRVAPAAAELPEGRQHATGGVVGNTLYVVGGRYFGKLNMRSTVFELDLTNLTAGWQTSSDRMPVARGGLSGGVVGNSIYSFGGEGNPSTYNGIFNNTEVFDTKSQSWTELPPMQVPRHGTQAAAVGNRIYIPGGGLQQDGKAVFVGNTTTYHNSSNRFDAYCA